MTDPKKTMTGLYIAAGVVLFLAVVLGAYSLGTRKPAAPADNAALANIEGNAERPAGLDESAATNAQEATNAAAPGNETDGTEGREEAAMAAAIEYKPDWSYSVDGHARDWSEVSIYAGKAEGKWTKILSFRWEGGRYAFVGEEPFPGGESKPAKKPAAKKQPPPGDRPLTEDDLKSIPKEFRPGESTALEAATSAPTDHERVEYVGKVKSHSADWSSAVVWIGPPEGEYCFEVHLKWDRVKQRYEVADARSLEAP